MKIGIMHGDDIGLEVVPEAVKVMKAAAAAAATMALLAAWLPARRLNRLDAASAFRSGR